ncbi:hypothetical protein CSOJ01_00675, partial [Colletotrichum sojae]
RGRRLPSLSAVREIYTRGPILASIIVATHYESPIPPVVKMPTVGPYDVWAWANRVALRFEYISKNGTLQTFPWGPGCCLYYRRRASYSCSQRSLCRGLARRLALKARGVEMTSMESTARRFLHATENVTRYGIQLRFHWPKRTTLQSLDATADFTVHPREIRRPENSAIRLLDTNGRPIDSGQIIESIPWAWEPYAHDRRPLSAPGVSHQLPGRTLGLAILMGCGSCPEAQRPPALAAPVGIGRLLAWVYSRVFLVLGTACAIDFAWPIYAVGNLLHRWLLACQRKTTVPPRITKRTDSREEIRVCVRDRSQPERERVIGWSEAVYEPSDPELQLFPAWTPWPFRPGQRRPFLHRPSASFARTGLACDDNNHPGESASGRDRKISSRDSTKYAIRIEMTMLYGIALLLFQLLSGIH